MKVWLKYKTDTGVNFLDKLKLVIRPSIWKYCIACSGQHKSVNLIIDFLLNLLFLNAWNVSWQHFIAFWFFFSFNLQLGKTILTISESLCVGTESEIPFILYHVIMIHIQTQNPMTNTTVIWKTLDPDFTTITSFFLIPTEREIQSKSLMLKINYFFLKHPHLSIPKNPGCPGMFLSCRFCSIVRNQK